MVKTKVPWQLLPEINAFWKAKPFSIKVTEWQTSIFQKKAKVMKAKFGICISHSAWYWIVMSDRKIDSLEENVIALLCPYLGAFAYDSEEYLVTCMISPALISSDSATGMEVKN